jgi:hypothetical protein
MQWYDYDTIDDNRAHNIPHGGNCYFGRDCIIQYLLSDTVLKPKTRGKLGASFRTTIGTPQGDALSPVLFTVYLEHVLREVRPLFDQWLWQEGNVHPRSGNSVCR